MKQFHENFLKIFFLVSWWLYFVFPTALKQKSILTVNMTPYCAWSIRLCVFSSGGRILHVLVYELVLVIEE